MVEAKTVVRAARAIRGLELAKTALAMVVTTQSRIRI